MARSLDSDLLPIVAILVTVVAIGLAAATLNDVTTLGIGDQTGPGGPRPNVNQTGGSPDLNQSGPGSGNRSARGGPLNAQNIPLTMCIRFLQTPLGVLSLVLGYGAFLWVIVRQYDAARASLTAYVTAPAVFIFYFVITQCATLPDYGNPQIAEVLQEPGGGGMTSVPVPPELLAVLFALVFLAGAGALLFATGSEETVEPPEPDEEDLDVEAFARAAGRAADRIEAADADVDNAVYRAWVEMTDLLDMPDPETSTPGEFAERAIETGMNAADVEELTRLFNEVRYGEKDPQAREERAVETLRSIESEYGSAGTAEDDAEYGSAGTAEDDDGSLAAAEDRSDRAATTDGDAVDDAREDDG